MTYLACPYSNPDKDIRQSRFTFANRAAYRLMKRGDCVFSPISHSHPVEVESGVINDGAFWMEQDVPILGKCTRLCVLTVPAWDKSPGVAKEIALATSMGIEIEYLGIEWAFPFENAPAEKTAYEQAAIITSDERNKNYGPPIENHTRIAQIWSGILNRSVTATEVILCMIGVKLAREAHCHKQDNFTDIIGYAKICDEDERFHA